MAHLRARRVCQRISPVSATTCMAVAMTRRTTTCRSTTRAAVFRPRRLVRSRRRGRRLLMRRRPSVDTVRVFSAADGVQTYEYSGGGCPRGRRRASAVPSPQCLAPNSCLRGRDRRAARNPGRITFGPSSSPRRSHRIREPNW